MGCDIHSYVETQQANGTWVRVPWEQQYEHSAGPFDWRSYGVFGLLADVRNYSMVPPLAQPRGLPDNTSEEVREAYEQFGWDAHSASWLGVDELLAFDYDQEFEDRRVTRGHDGGATAEPGDGRMTTFREFLEWPYFKDLDALRALHEQQPTRIVFWFST